MPVPPMHLHGCSNSSRLKPTITECLLSKHGDMSAAIGSLPATTFLRLFASAFWGGGECNPCILEDPQQRGRKSEVPASPCLLGGPKEGAPLIFGPLVFG